MIQETVADGHDGEMALFVPPILTAIEQFGSSNIKIDVVAVVEFKRQIREI
jgi:hypothetical protein